MTKIIENNPFYLKSIKFSHCGFTLCGNLEFKTESASVQYIDIDKNTTVPVTLSLSVEKCEKSFP
jgi:hypothetical protein